MEVVTPPQDLSAAAAMVWAWAAEFLPRLGTAILILAVGYVAATWAGTGVARLAGRVGRIDPTLRPLFGVIVRYGIMIVIGVAALGQLGIQTASILAALGAAGLAIGLALQGTLSNIAAGIMLIWLRPFGIGDYIETGAVSGTVREVGLFHTQIQTWDGIYRFVPNSQLWNVALTNYSRFPTRLVLVNFAIGYDADIAAARGILVATARRHAAILDNPAPVAIPLEFTDTGVIIQLRVWTQLSRFWDVRADLVSTGKQALEAAGIKNPVTPQTAPAAGLTGGPGSLPPAPSPGPTDISPVHNRHGSVTHS